MPSLFSPANRFAALLQTLGEAYLARGQYAEAAEKLGQLVASGNRDPGVHRNLALAMLALQRCDAAALRFYQSVLQLLPEDNELFVKICTELLAHQCNDAFAQDCYQKVLLANLAAPELLAALVRHFLAHGQEARAWEACKRLVLQENGDRPRNVARLVRLGWRLGRESDLRTVLTYLAGRNEKAPWIRRLLALDQAYELLRVSEPETRNPRAWQILAEVLPNYGKLETISATREFSALYLAWVRAQGRNARTGVAAGEKEAANGHDAAEAQSPAETPALEHELLRRLRPPVPPDPAAERTGVPAEVLVLRLANLEQVIAGTGESVAQALAARFVDFCAKYLAKAAHAVCYPLSDGLLVWAGSLKLLAISAVDLLHKVERYNATAKPGTQLMVHLVVHSGNGAAVATAEERLRVLYEALHMLDAVLPVAGRTAVRERRANRLLLPRQTYEQKLRREILPARFAGAMLPEVPGFQAELYEAVWRNPLEYVQEKAPYQLGRFLVTEKLRGSRFSGTYRGRDQKLERTVILKALSPQHSLALLQVPAWRERLVAAIRQIGRLEIPGVAMIHDMGYQEEIFFFAREYLEGKSFDQILQSRRQLSPMESLAIGVRVCRTLHAAHRHHVMHCNLKPANLWLLPSGEVKVADFHVPGFVEKFDADNQTTASAWQYSAPEWRREAIPSVTGDVYALGMILYELLAGEHPYASESDLTRWEEMEFPPLESHVPDLPPLFSAILGRACRNEPEQRYQNMAEFEAALRSLVDLLVEQEARSEGSHPAGPALPRLLEAEYR